MHKKERLINKAGSNKKRIITSSQTVANSSKTCWLVLCCFFIHCRSRSTKSSSYNVPPSFVNLLQHAHVQTVAYRPQLIIWGYKSYGVVRTYRSLVTSNKCKFLLLEDLSLLNFNPLWHCDSKRGAWERNIPRHWLLRYYSVLVQLQVPLHDIYNHGNKTRSQLVVPWTCYSKPRCQCH